MLGRNDLPPKVGREPPETISEAGGNFRTISGAGIDTSSGALIGIILTDIFALPLNWLVVL